jgi:F-type H+-transporting ATPase subunit alpha
MRQVAGTLRLDLAQFREKAAFAQFGSDLDAATQRQLARGQRLVEILKQDQYVPMPVERQVVVIYAGVNGFLDKHPTNKLKEYEAQLADFISKKHPAIYTDIVSKGQIDADIKGRLEAALREFDGIFTA